MTSLVSDRGLPLIWSSTDQRDRPVLTLEDYLKWYTPYLVYPDGRVEAVTPWEEELRPFTPERESSVGDHVWNPTALLKWAEARGYDFDDAAYERLVGRWTIEHEERR
jgi:hypothetical protein